MNDRTLLRDRAPMVFAGSPLDRCELLRRDAGALDDLRRDPAARLILLQDGDALLTPDQALMKQPFDAAQWHARPDSIVFLGKDERGPLFAAMLDGALPDAPATPAREAAMRMPHPDAAIYAQAKSLLAWHERHGFCAVCGTATRIASGGAKRVCPNCSSEHFPRVDPVVIMLVTDGENCLLGRQASWPAGIWSALAGFVEPAETLEEACAREVLEETGVPVDIAGIRYAFTQPWPFPSSIMVGLVAPATATRIQVDTHELEQARWFTRAEIRAMLAGEHSDASLPPSIAVARRLTELWAAGEI